MIEEGPAIERPNVGLEAPRRIKKDVADLRAHISDLRLGPEPRFARRPDAQPVHEIIISAEQKQKVSRACGRSDSGSRLKLDAPPPE